MHRFVRTSLTLCVMLVAPLSFAQGQQHRYNFNNSLADANGGPSLVSDGGVLGANGYTFGPNQGLSLSNVFSAATSYSLAIRSYFTDLGGYRKIVDFKDRVSDNGYYALVSQAVFYPTSSGPPNTYAVNTPAFTVLTRDATTNVFKYYVGGVLQGTFVDAAAYGDFTAANGIARFFEDDFATGQRESSGGFVDYIATYDRALTDTEVAGLGVVTATPEPASAALLATGLVGVFGVAHRRRRNAGKLAA